MKSFVQSTLRRLLVVTSGRYSNCRRIFDLSTDADGRWSVEKFKGLVVQLERECKRNRESKHVAVKVTSWYVHLTSLQHSLLLACLDYTPSLCQLTLQVDDTGSTFAGVLNGRTCASISIHMRSGDYVTVGYKGTNPYDAGIFYCPYVPLQMVRAVGENDFQPRIGFKTRYGMVSNPFVGSTPADGLAAAPY